MGLKLQGLILDTSILVAAERRGNPVTEVMRFARELHGNVDIAISAVTVIELTHGIYRANTPELRERRRIFTDDAFDDLIVHPLTLEIARLAGRIEGQQAARGFVIPFEDLVIGCTALFLDFSVATLNVRHFELIPGINVVAL